MAQQIDGRITQLREKMQEKGIDIYVVPTADFHESEYVGAHFMARKFITGFTGSAGIAVITQKEANVWTDGRYFVQAAAELQGSSVILRKMGNEGTPTIPEYLEDTLEEGGCIGFDGRVVNAGQGMLYQSIAERKHGKVLADHDLVGQIWQDRPALSCAPAWLLDESCSGKSTADKLAEIRGEMENAGCNTMLISCLYDIAWILNVRGGDISYVPVVLSYLAICNQEDQPKAIWFVQEGALNEKIRGYLAENQIETRPYDSFYNYISALPEADSVWADSSVLNFRAWNNIPKNCKVTDQPVPSVLMRSLKNETEQKNSRIAHEKDAVAMIRFMYWLKTNVGKIPMTEISAADQLASFRAEQEGFLDLSFSTIPGYAEHGAIVHYHATEASDIPLEAKGLFLVDSGGHYLEGSTDITRTFALGPVTDEMKADFTRVVRSNRCLAEARFKYGVTGQHLDMIARAPFWEVAMDYNHGTGHGVGHILNVHEGPQGIRWKARSPKSEGAAFMEGMITSDEPGIYLEGKYGIRIENELLCHKGPKNEYGQFMYFEDLTLVPIDLDAVEPGLMSDVERGYLNSYHERVYQKMAPHFEGEMQSWLRYVTRPI